MLLSCAAQQQAAGARGNSHWEGNWIPLDQNTRLVWQLFYFLCGSSCWPVLGLRVFKSYWSSGQNRRQFPYGDSKKYCTLLFRFIDLGDRSFCCLRPSLFFSFALVSWSSGGHGSCLSIQLLGWQGQGTSSILGTELGVAGKKGFRGIWTVYQEAML
jgi:hypothetical protein